MVLLRRTNYLGNLFECKNLKSLSPIDLDPEILFFTEKASKNFANYIHSTSKNEPYEHESVFVTAKERSQGKIRGNYKMRELK